MHADEEPDGDARDGPDGHDAARRAACQSTRHVIELERENADVLRATARAYAARAGHVDAIPDDLLERYEHVLRDEASAMTSLADAIGGELRRRGGTG